MKAIRILLLALSIAAGTSALAQTDISGTWAGKLPAGPGQTLDIHFVLTRAGDGYSAILKSPTAGAIPETPATSTSFADNRLVMTVDSLAGRYEGVLENGKFTGNWHQQGTALPLELVPYVEAVLSAEAKAALQGSWVGELSVPQAGVTLAIVFRFENRADGSFVGFLDSPDQGANGIAAAGIALADGALSFTVPQLSADYKGTLDGDSMTGTFTQVGMAFPLNMARGEYRPRGATLSQEAIDRLEGSWVGRAQNPAGATVTFVFRFEPNGPGNVVAMLDLPEQGTRNIPMTELTLEGDQLSFVVAAAQASYRATLSADGMTGSWAQGNSTRTLAMARGEYVPTDAALDLPAEALARLRGTWTGSMQPPQGGTIELVVRFETTADGVNLAFLDVPTRGAAGLVITAATLTGDALELSVPAGGLTIAGTVADGTFSGEWRQGTTNVPVTLTRQP
jgi:hypothetical protein